MSFRIADFFGWLSLQPLAVVGGALIVMLAALVIATGADLMREIG